MLAGNNAEGNFSVKYYEGKFNAYQRTYVFTANEAIVCPNYLYYALKLCLLDFKRMSQGTSTKFLTTKILNSFELRLPTITTQKKIVRILRSLEDKIAINSYINHNLLAIAQSLFDSQISETHSMGDGYSKGVLTDIAEFMNGLAMQKHSVSNSEDGLPVLKIRELGQGACDSNSDKCSSSIPKQYIVNDGDIIFSWSGTLMVDYWCGGRCGLNQHLFKVSSEKYPGWFIFFWTKHHLDRFIRIAQDKAVTMGHIRRIDLEQSEVLIPSVSTMKTLEDEIGPLMDEYVLRRIENRKLQEIRDGILPQLISGTIAISC